MRSVRTVQTAVVELDDLILCFNDQLPVDSNFAVFIDDNGDALSIGGEKELIKQSGLAGSEETRQDSGLELFQA
jgi:hypothetical protein